MQAASHPESDLNFNVERRSARSLSGTMRMRPSVTRACAALQYPDGILSTFEDTSSRWTAAGAPGAHVRG